MLEGRFAPKVESKRREIDGFYCDCDLIDQPHTKGDCAAAYRAAR